MGPNLTQGRRTGLRHRVQDIHHCGAGDSVWDLQQLAAGGGILDWKVLWGVLREALGNSKSIEVWIVIWAG